MLFAPLLASLHVIALAVIALDPVLGRNVFTLEQTALGATVLAWTPARRAMITALGHYWPAAIAFAAATGLAAWQAGLLGTPSTAFNPFAARAEIWNLIALFFAMAATAGIAGAVGRRPIHNALLAATLVLVALDAVGKLQYGPEHPLLQNASESAAVYGLLALLAVFVAHDELTTPQSGRSNAKRLVLPGMAFAAAIAGFLMSRAPEVSPALAAGIGLTVLVLSLRNMPSPLGFLLAAAGVLGIGGAVSLALSYSPAADPFGVVGFNDSLLTALKGASGLGSNIEGGMLQSWPVEAGIYGATAMAAATLLTFMRLAFSADRRRTPSRGLSLAMGAATLTALAGSGGGATACATLALLVGLSCAYADRLRFGVYRQSSRRVTSAMGFDNGSARPAT